VNLNSVFQNNFATLANAQILISIKKTAHKNKGLIL